MNFLLTAFYLSFGANRSLNIYLKLTMSVEENLRLWSNIVSNELE